MTQFYINNELVNVVVAPVINVTEDGTLDSANVVLEANNNPYPLAPMQLFKIVFDDGTKLLFFIATDTVTINSVAKKTYTHKLVITQNIRDASKYLLRNTVFTQPPQLDKKAYSSIPYVLQHNPGPAGSSRPKLIPYQGVSNPTAEPMKWVEPLKIDKREKIANVWYKIQSQVFIGTSNDSQDATLVHVGPVNPAKYVYNGGDNSFIFYIRLVDEPSIYQSIIVTDTNIMPDQKVYDDRLTTFVKNHKDKKMELYIIPETNMNYMVELPPNDQLPQYVGGLDADHPFFMVFQLEVGVDTYYYTAYDVLDIINKQYQKNDQYHSHEPLYNLPTSGELYDLLTNTIAPNFTFTQATYFEAVNQVFSLFDAIFTLDENRVLGIEYLNKSQREPIETDFAGMTISLGEDKYNNGLVSYYQNALLNEKYPASPKDYKCYAPVRSPNLGVPAKENSFHFLLPHAIDLLNKCYIKASGTTIVPSHYLSSSGYVQISSETYPLDITKFVFESSIWSLLNTTGTYPYQDRYDSHVQNNSLTYSRGSKEINVSSFYRSTVFGLEYASLWNVIKSASHRYFGVPLKTEENDYMFNFANPKNMEWTDVFMSVEYIARVDGRLKVESVSPKYNGEYLTNQSGGEVDLGKLGLNMLGVSFKTGEPTMNVTQEKTTWQNAIKKGQVYVDENGNRWVANVCIYTIFNDFISTEVQFVKNFNGLAQFTRIDRKKRLSNISRELAVKSEDNYCEYLYISSYGNNLPASQEIALNRIADSLDTDGTLFGKQLAGTFGLGQEHNIDFVKLVTVDGNIIINRVACPMVKYGAGNALCFEMTMDDPISAGNKTKIVSTGWFGENKYFTSAVKYTNENGFFDSCTIVFETSSVSKDFNNDYPILNNIKDEWSQMGRIDLLQYYKKPNEIFALNYEIICLPYHKSIEFIGNKFITENGLVKGQNPSQFYIYCTNQENAYNISSTKGIGQRFKINKIKVIATNSNIFELSIKHENTPLNTKSWAICDENGNIYFASNSQKIFFSSQILYFIPRHDRL